ncbi:MAG: ABC transporter substrate-binding protein [Gemmatimonadaceae bacterium]
MNCRKVTLVLALLATSACGRDSRPVLIAAAGPWEETYGIMNRRGIELALAEVNAQGGVGGRELRMLMRDDKGDGMRAANIAAEFVGNQDVVAVVGHVNSGAMVAAARVYDQGLPALSTTASTPDLTGISPWVFRVISSDSVNGLDLARYARSLGYSRAAVLYENNSYGRGLADSFERNFDGSIVVFDPIPEDGDSDMEPYIAYLRVRKPDVVFVAGTEPSGAALLREARRQGLDTPMLGSDGWTGLVQSPALAEGVLVGAPFTPADPRPDVQRFVTAFKERFGVAPDGNAALAYDATRVVARAVAEGGASREKVRGWLASRSQDTAFPGVTGPIYFEASGDVVGKGFVMTQMRNGELVVNNGGRR